MLPLAEAETDPELAVAATGGGLALTELWDLFAALLTEQRPALAILDSRADLYGANENDRTQARRFCGALRRLGQRSGTTVMLIGHPSLSGLQSGGSSGSTAWHNSARARFQLAAPDPDADPDPDARLLQMRKNNYGPLIPDLRLRRGAGVFHREGGGAPTALGRAAAMRGADRLFMDLLDRFTTQGRFLCDRTGRGFAPAEFAREPDAQGITSRGFEAAMRRLFKAGSITVTTTGPPSKQRRQIVAVEPEGGPE